MFIWTVHFSRFVRGHLVDDCVRVRAWTKRGAREKWELDCADKPLFAYFNRVEEGFSEANRGKTPGVSTQTAKG